MRKNGIVVWAMLVIFISVSILFVNTDIFAAETGMDGAIADDQAELQSMLESFETDIPHEEGELVVGFRDDASAPKESKEIAAQEAVQSSEIIDASTVLVTVEEGQDVQDVIRDLAEDRDIAYIEPNYELSSCEDPELYALSGDPYDLYHLDALHIDGLWQRVSQSAVYVPTLAIIDTGCLLSHEDLRYVVDHELSVDVTTRDSNGQYEKIRNLEVPDPGNHGTNVASVASAMANNDIGIAGVASCYSNDKVKTVAVKIANTNGKFYISDLVKALTYAMDLGVDVINMSVGTQADSTPLHNKLKEVYNSGIIMVAAAGNKPVSGYSQNSPNYPSDYDEVISITSLSSNLESSCMSKGYLYGPYKDFAAFGEQVTTASNISNSSYVYSSGTSFASPMVASIVALLKTMQPDLTFQDVYEIFKTTATDIYSESEGIAKGFDEYTGWGLVNAALAGCQLKGHSLFRADPGSDDETYVCTYCSRSFVKHPAVEATCETDGNTQYYYCPDTEQYYADDLCIQQVEADSWNTKAKGHDFSAEDPSARYLRSERTCTEPATYYYKCSRCDASGEEEGLYYEYGGFPGHQWNDGDITTPATCTKDGEKTFTCTVCHDTRFETIEKSGHQWTEKITKKATCTADGEIIYTCSNCSETRTETIPATGHQWDEESIKAPTCTDSGTTVNICRNCGKKKTISVPATGHQWNKGKVTKRATCEKTGEKTYTCNACGKTRRETIPKAQHQFDQYMLNKATLTKNGSMTLQCSECGTVKSKSVIYRPDSFKLSSASFTYNGKERKPSVTVTDIKGKVIDPSSYKVSWSNNKNVGDAVATIKFKGNYSGKKTLSFKIHPQPTTMNTVTGVLKGFTVKWKKQATQTTGYQIQYSANKDFKSGNKTVTVTNTSTLSKKITGLKAKTTYYVRIRTYKTVNGTKYYSSWSDAKTVKTK